MPKFNVSGREREDDRSQGIVGINTVDHNTRIDLACTPDEARKLAIDLILAAERADQLAGVEDAVILGGDRGRMANTLALAIPAILRNPAAGQELYLESEARAGRFIAAPWATPPARNPARP